MIEIYVNHKPLAIPPDTSVVLEQNSNLLGESGFGSDIVWTFDIPAEENTEVLDGAQYVYKSGAKKYGCDARHNGVVVATGSLYVQQATRDTISCGMTINEMGDKWGERKLKDNEYGEDIVIADNINDHKEGWRALLRQSLHVDSIFKFFLFGSSSLYQDNDAFGHHINQQGESVLSGLDNEDTRADDSPQYRSYVNRLFLNGDSDIIELGDGVSQGVRIFNRQGDAGTKMNGYTFCPALRLDWLLRKVFANAGYSVSGDFLRDYNVQQLYVQSLHCMDGDELQYPKINQAEVMSPVAQSSVYSAGGSGMMVKTDSGYGPGFQFDRALDDFLVNFQFFLPDNQLPYPTTQPSGLWKGVQKSFAILIKRTDAAMPAQLWASAADTESNVFVTNTYLTAKTLMFDADDNIKKIMPSLAGYAIIEYNASSVGSFRILTPSPLYGIVLLTPTSPSPNANYTNREDSYKRGIAKILMTMARNQSIGYELRLVQCDVLSSLGVAQQRYPYSTDDAEWSFNSFSSLFYIDNIEQVTGEIYTDYEKHPLNIFDSKLRWKDHVPNLTNAELVKAISDMFALNVYVDSARKDVELSFFSNIDKAGAIDITDYVIDKEVTRETYEPKRYEITIDSTRPQKEMAEPCILPDVTVYDALPLAEHNENRHAFVETENMFRSVEHKDDNSYSWTPGHGNDKALKVGDSEDDPEKVSIDVKVPNMRTVDTHSGYTDKYVMEIDEQGVSPMFDKEYTGEFDLIITQYRGTREITLKEDPENGQIARARIEVANPTSYFADGTKEQGYIDLTTTGETSIGEQRLKPLYRMLSNNIPVTLRAIVPTHIALEVYRLMAPQGKPASMQQRWLIFQNQRYLPKRVTYEFGSGENVLLTIEAIRYKI